MKDEKVLRANDAPVVPSETVGIQPFLGERLRAMRLEQRRSLAEIAEATGISPSFLSMVESGKSDITISRLVRVVRALNVHLSDVVGDPKLSTPLVVRKEMQETMVHSRGEGVELMALAGGTGHAMMPVISIYEAGGQTMEYAVHEGEEFVYVVKATIELVLDGRETIVLNEGDTAYFRADHPHIYRNPGTESARVLTVVTPPSL